MMSRSPLDYIFDAIATLSLLLQIGLGLWAATIVVAFGAGLPSRPFCMTLLRRWLGPQ